MSQDMDLLLEYLGAVGTDETRLEAYYHNQAASCGCEGDRMKHTKGPWKLQNKSDTGLFRVLPANSNEGIAIAGTLQDAALIAAAPELLDSCKEILETLNSGILLETLKNKACREALANDLTTLISKAEGGNL